MPFLYTLTVCLFVCRTRCVSQRKSMNRCVQRCMALWINGSTWTASSPNETNLNSPPTWTPQSWSRLTFLKPATCVFRVFVEWDVAHSLGMYRISGSVSGWPDIWPFFAIRFRIRPKHCLSPDSATG